MTSFDPASLSPASSPSFGRRVSASLGLGALFSLAATTAMAHEGTGLVGGFMAGVLHPLNGPDHLLAMVAVGLWGAILGRPLVVALPIVFPAMMAVGGVMGILALPMPPVEIGIGFSVVILGLVIAMAFKPPAWAAVAIVAVFALFHGYAHGQELPSAADPIGYSVGFVLSTGALHLIGVGIGYLIVSRDRLTLLRLIGAAIGLAGLWFVYGAVAA